MPEIKIKNEIWRVVIMTLHFLHFSHAMPFFTEEKLVKGQKRVSKVAI